MTMYEITITTPESFTVTSRDRSVDVNVTELGVDILAQAVVHGLTQCIADAGAGALESVALDDVGEKPHKGKDLTDAQKAQNRAWAAKLAAAKESLAGTDRVKDRGRDLMAKRLDKLVAGEWDTRGPATAALSPLDERVYVLAHKAYKAGHKVEWKEASTAQRKANVLAWVAESGDATKATYENAAKAQLDAEAALAAALGSIDLPDASDDDDDE